MNWIEAIILGIVQGLTEFLPVSSSGHLEIGSVLLGIEPTNNLLFAIVVHTATALSTIYVYREDIRGIVLGLFEFKNNESLRFSLLIVVSMIPVGIIGVFFEEDIAQLFAGNLLLVGGMLLVTSALLFITHFAKPSEGKVTLGKALIIGLAQAVAIIPGISRSGATISTALMLGVEKSKAARFSFLMVLIPILGASLLKLKDFLEEPAMANDIAILPLILGFFAAFISGYAACKWMIGIVRKGKLTYFAIYCAIVGLIALGSQLWM